MKNLGILTKFTHIFDDKEKIKTSVGASFLLSLTLLFFGPSYIYYGNILEIPYYYSDMVWLFLACALAAGLIISTIILFLQGSVHQRAVAVVFAMGLLFWIQGHILVWDYGVLDGREIIWENYLLNGLIDSAIWAGLLAIAVIKGPTLYKHIALVSVLLLVVQGIGLASEIFQAPDEPEWKGHLNESDDDVMFEFSKDQNVIILVLDMFQSDLFQEIIDEVPEYRKIFDGFTYYRNAVGVHPTTYPSVTSILTGEHYDNAIPIQEHIKKSFLYNSIPKMLKENGYQVDLFPHVPQTIFFSNEIASNIGTGKNLEVGKSVDNTKGVIELERLTMFRYVPHFVKEKFYFVPFVGLGDNDNLNEAVIFKDSLISQTSIINNTKVMKFYHIVGAHPPYTINAQLQNEELPQNRSGAIEQAKGSLKIAGELIKQLKSHDIYDNSIIFIVADHGNPWERVGLNTSPITICKNKNGIDKKVISSGIPLILFKPNYSNGILKISDAPVTLGDIPKTISSELRISCEFSGISLLNISESDERERNFYFYNWDDGWDKEYLPQINKYSINGHSWCLDSWKNTYQISNPGEESIFLFPTYEYGDEIHFSRNGTSDRFKLDGWSYPEEKSTWTDGKNASLNIITDDTDSNLILIIRATPYLSKGALEKQRVNISANDHPLGEWVFNKPGFQEKSIIIPHEVLNEGMQYITFDLPDAISPQSLGLSEDSRVLALAVQSIVISNSTESIQEEYK